MFIFIVPLKSRTVSNSWARVSKLFERTARSICAQTSSEFRVIVVCNELPETEFSHPNMEFVLVNIFPIESTIESINRGREDDKARRIMIGMEKANEYNPSFVMVVDADDCVRNDLVEYVKSQSENKGWYLTSGYIYTQGSRCIYRKKRDFQKVCGSTLILKPEDVSKVIIHDAHGHCYWHQSLPSEELPLKPLPFPAAVYTVRNLENHHMTQSKVTEIRAGQYGTRLKTLLRRMRNYRFSVLTRATRQIFGLYSI